MTVVLRCTSITSMGRSLAVPRILLSCLLSSALVAIAPSCSRTSGPPRAVVEATDVDLGSRAPGEPAVAKFAIRNAGGEPLQVEVGEPVPRLRGVRTEVSGAPAFPGQQATVAVTLDTEALGGARTYDVPVATNDPLAAELMLHVTLDVRPMLQVDPPSVHYEPVEGDREAPTRQTLWSADGATFRVLRVEAPAPELRVSFAEVSRQQRRDGVAGSQWEIVSTLPATATSRSLVGELVVVTDHPRQQRLRIPVSGAIKPQLAATPPAAILGRVEAGQPRQLTIHLRSLGSREVTIERAQSSVPGILVEVEPVTPGRAYRLKVSTSDELREGTIEGTIDVVTGGDQPRSTAIPLRGEVVKPAAGAAGAP